MRSDQQGQANCGPTAGSHLLGLALHCFCIVPFSSPFCSMPALNFTRSADAVIVHHSLYPAPTPPVPCSYPTPGHRRSLHCRGPARQPARHSHPRVVGVPLGAPGAGVCARNLRQVRRCGCGRAAGAAELRLPGGVAQRLGSIQAQGRPRGGGVAAGAVGGKQEGSCGDAGAGGGAVRRAWRQEVVLCACFAWLV